MRLLINAVGLRAGGGLTVGLNCLRGIREARPDYEMLALVPAGCGYEEQCATLAIPFKAFPKTPLYPLWRLWFDQVQVPGAARQWAADVLFSMNNQAAWAVSCPQVVLLHNAYSIYPVADWWSLLGPFDRSSLLLQRALFSVIAPRRCARVAVQTPVAARRLEERYGIPANRLAIVPNAIALEHHGPETEAGRQLGLRIRAAARGRAVVLTLARYYPHKDLEFILRVARTLLDRGDRRFVFFITIAAEQHPGARALLARIDREHLSEDVVNLGPLDFSELRSAYDATQICFLPTLLESMSGTHLEALHYQLPIVTTERDFAWDACGTAARYFPVGDVDAAIRQLHAVLDARERERRSTAAAAPRSWSDVCQELGSIIDAARRRPAGAASTVEAVSPGTQIR
jgi:glycosyltransferase involved in cell wall biosynthesis